MNEDKIILKLLEHDERLERVEGKIDKMLTRDEFTKTSDQMMVILKRLDEERIFTYSWIRRVEEEVGAMKMTADRHERDLQRVKKELHIV